MGLKNPLNVHLEHSVRQKEIIPNRKRRVSHTVWNQKIPTLYLSQVPDHQSLTRVFGPNSNIPPLVAAKLQRWAVLLSGYDYDIVY